MKKIFIVFLISIAFARLYALEKPKKGNEYILFQAFPVNSKTQENGNNLWLELIK